MELICAVEQGHRDTINAFALHVVIMVNTVKWTTVVLVHLTTAILSTWVHAVRSNFAVVQRTRTVLAAWFVVAYDVVQAVRASAESVSPVRMNTANFSGADTLASQWYGIWIITTSSIAAATIFGIRAASTGRRIRNR